ncbi:hypothetical protein NQ011_09535 [Corynebacterium phoceense]|uniref:hypothetical protein n=1 Tax=Corynebacterium phoceense TaxID=1686286 RepID=UPI00211BD105|nr:hypothetical protein [Corynebacterium phoceense]MCQ9336924.1 hypothetical protein [Corynebacterium phoceense]
MRRYFHYCTCGGISQPGQNSGTVDIGALKTKILETVRDINLADNTVDGEDDE